MSRAAGAIEAVPAVRGDNETICPGEAARLPAGAGGDRRAVLPQVQARVHEQEAAGAVRPRWRGEPVDPARGPCRIAGS